MKFFICGILVLFPSLVFSQCLVESYYSPYDNVEAHIVSRLAEARESICCSLYGITNRRITTLLQAKARSDVSVKLCIDKRQSTGKRSTHRALARAGAEVVIKKTGMLEHNKFCIIDGKRVIMGSWNFSQSAQKQDNSLIDISGCDLSRFNEAWTRIYERDR